MVPFFPFLIDTEHRETFLYYEQNGQDQGLSYFPAVGASTANQAATSSLKCRWYSSSQVLVGVCE